MAFDVYMRGDGKADYPEQDSVYLVDKDGKQQYLGELRGDNGVWHANGFEVPIDSPRFPGDMEAMIFMPIICAQE